MNILERYTNPSKHVLEPYGTIFKNGTQYFIQVSKDPETATWITMGELFDACFGGSNLKEDFVLQCLDIYSTHSCSNQLAGE